MQNKSLELEDKIETCNTVNKTISEDNKTYSDKMRLIVYDMLTAGTPTGNISGLIKKIAERLDVKFDSIPQKSTIEQMAREMGVISDVACAELIMNTPNCTIAFDATTQEGVHVNVVSLSTPERSSVIALDQLPGGTADDYAAHVTNSIDNIARSYSEVHNQDFVETRDSLVSNISNCLTDRAIVNHAAVSKINATWDKTLNELKCHLHPLESVATGCKNALKKTQMSKSHLFGNDCHAAQIILNVDKLRFKDGKGDPQGFKLFLKKLNLPLGLFPRYRGNRLHILFHNAGIIIQYLEQLKEYLATTLVRCGNFVSCLLNDLSMEEAINQLCVLGLIGKLFSGPWMTKFYAVANGELTHMGAIDVVKSVLHEITKACANPLGLLSLHTDFFGTDASDPVLKSIQLLCKRDQAVCDMIRNCLSATQDVLCRQYEHYLQMDITQELIEETDSARLHNIDCEQIMGMFSAVKDKAPAATLCYISSKIRAKQNRVVENYLDVMTTEKRKAIISWAVSAARKKRSENKKRL